jgi:hypothetical protein
MVYAGDFLVRIFLCCSVILRAGSGVPASLACCSCSPGHLCARLLVVVLVRACNTSAAEQAEQAKMVTRRFLIAAWYYMCG